MMIPAIHGAAIYTRDVHSDHRGYFSEIYRNGSIPAVAFVQQNVSQSDRGVLRGMHLQTTTPQAKLVTGLYGRVHDVLFDLRQNSPTFGHGVSIEIGQTEGQCIYVPAGVAHGFLVLSEIAIVQYNCSTFYDPAGDVGVRWDSPGIRTHFPTFIDPVLSARDRQLPPVAEYLKKVR